MNQKQVIVLEKVNHSYYSSIGDEIEIFKNLNLKINHGEKIGLLGPSGSGKTTFLKLIGGITKVNHGYVNLQSQSFLIPQIPILNPFNTCNELINLSLEDSKSIFEDSTLLKIAHMEKYDNTLFMNLSSGEKQRIVLLCALASGSRVILADEPFGRLDIKTANEMRKFFLDIVNEYNITLVMVTHFLFHLKDFDRIFKIENNSLKEIKFS